MVYDKCVQYTTDSIVCNRMAPSITSCSQVSLCSEFGIEARSPTLFSGGAFARRLAAPAVFGAYVGPHGARPNLQANVAIQGGKLGFAPFDPIHSLDLAPAYQLPGATIRLHAF